MVRSFARSSLPVVVALFLACGIVQVFLAGLGVFDDPGAFITHREFGYLFGWLTLVALALALVGRQPGRITGLCALLLGQFALQSVLVALRPTLPAVAALHPLNGFLLLAVAAVTIRLSWAARPRRVAGLASGSDPLLAPDRQPSGCPWRAPGDNVHGGRLMVTVGKRAYDLMYRFGAPWEGADRVELRALVRDGRVPPRPCDRRVRRLPAPSTSAVVPAACRWSWPTPASR